jgi:hypothetical protein
MVGKVSARLLSPIARLLRLGWAIRSDPDEMTLRDEIRYIIGVLDTPSSNEDMGNGWDQELRKKWKDWFEELDKKIINGDELPYPLSIARAMDFDGVGRTKISNIAAGISNRLNGGERY